MSRSRFVLQQQKSIKGLSPLVWMTIGVSIGVSIGHFSGTFGGCDDIMVDLSHMAYQRTLKEKGLSSSSSSSSTATKKILDLPKQTKSIIINIGSNIDPIYPKSKQGPCALSIAFEPIVPFQVHKHPQVHVVPAAVSDSAGLQTMYSFNKIGVSSSLSQPAKADFWNQGRQKGATKLVPVIPMIDVVNAIPTDVSVDLIMTDAQGYDYTIIKSAISEIRSRGFKYLKTEVYLDQVTTYKDVENDFCQNWLPMMTENGYTFVRLEQDDEGYGSLEEAQKTCSQAKGVSKTAGLKERDALWVLTSLATIPDIEVFLYEKLQADTKPAFSKQEYGACNT